MGNVDDLLLLLALIGAVGLWMKASAARERAVAEARAQCERYGLQLLDESVGLRGLRLRRIDGHLMLERGYGFEVSTDGADREAGSLWIVGGTLSELSLPTVVLRPAEPPARATSTASHADEPAPQQAGSNVVPLRRRQPQGDARH